MDYVSVGLDEDLGESFGLGMMVPTQVGSDEA